MAAKVKKSSSSVLKSLSDKCQLSRFSDYFVICGLDFENGLEADLYAGELLLRCWIFLFCQLIMQIIYFFRWCDESQYTSARQIIQEQNTCPLPSARNMESVRLLRDVYAKPSARIEISYSET